MMGRMCVVDQMRQDTLPKGRPDGRAPVMGKQCYRLGGSRQVVPSPPIISHLG